jgi:hypothetical protein
MSEEKKLTEEEMSEATGGAQMNLSAEKTPNRGALESGGSTQAPFFNDAATTEIYTTDGGLTRSSPAPSRCGRDRTSSPTLGTADGGGSNHLPSFAPRTGAVPPPMFERLRLGGHGRGRLGAARPGTDAERRRGLRVHSQRDGVDRAAAPDRRHRRRQDRRPGERVRAVGLRPDGYGRRGSAGRYVLPRHQRPQGDLVGQRLQLVLRGRPRFPRRHPHRRRNVRCLRRHVLAGSQRALVLGLPRGRSRTPAPGPRSRRSSGTATRRTRACARPASRTRSSSRSRPECARKAWEWSTAMT